ncbi:hypothetical protein CGZ96_09920 [Enemella evansiae]|uniref:LamB/YcsF family protein n=1 Tax=Enemella evansiae TaxID=2016499 RepID=UPI000B967806|nr:5-oxoprolinase subunit PxpA [Enemella evansiae]OYN98023.1 hypothetical protein CGZ96_09920 [Enemella evansiae]
MTATIDLVADLGEGFGAWRMGDDDALLEIVTSANIACGFHAGDPEIMDATVATCSARGIGVGAHPSFPDLVGFGRRDLSLSPNQVRTDVLYQVGALTAFAEAHGTTVRHVAPHGRLGNLVGVRPDYAAATAEAIHGIDPGLIVVAQDGAMADAARAIGLQVGIVAIIDRGYLPDGTLVRRGEPGDLIRDPEVLVARAVRVAAEGKIDTVDGGILPIEAHSILLHGDSADAVASARAIRAGLLDAGVQLAPLAEVLTEGGR